MPTQSTQSPQSRKRKLDVPEAAPMEPESTPFLCNIVQPSKHSVTLGMSLTFPSPRSPGAALMDPTDVDEEDSWQPPKKLAKRPRHSLFPQPMKKDTEVASVLQTPPINRSRRSSAVVGSSNRPASILKDKMNRFMNNSMFNSSQLSVGDVQHLSESEMEVEVADTSKQLRFTLPQMVSPSNSGSELMDASDADEMMHMTQKEEFLSFVEENDTSPTKFSTTCRDIHDMDITRTLPQSLQHSDEGIPLVEEVDASLKQVTYAIRTNWMLLN